MKQLIVLVATIILGLVIGGIVMGFGDDAQAIADVATNSFDVVTASGIEW